MEEGNREKAVEVFSKLIKMEPNNEEFFDVWQRLSEDIGHTKGKNIFYPIINC